MVYYAILQELEIIEIISKWKFQLKPSAKNN